MDVSLANPSTYKSPDRPPSETDNLLLQLILENLRNLIMLLREYTFNYSNLFSDIHEYFAVYQRILGLLQIYMVVFEGQVHYPKVFPASLSPPPIFWSDCSYLVFRGKLEKLTI